MTLSPEEVPLVLFPLGCKLWIVAWLICNIWVLLCYTAGPAIPTGPSRGCIPCYALLSHAVSIRLIILTTITRKLLLKEYLQTPTFGAISRNLHPDDDSASCWVSFHVKFQGTCILERSDTISVCICRSLTSQIFLRALEILLMLRTFCW